MRHRRSYSIARFRVPDKDLPPILGRTGRAFAPVIRAVEVGWEGVRVQSSPYHAVLERALEHTLTHLGRLDQAPVAATTSLAELHARLDVPLDDRGVDAAQVIDELVAGCAGGIVGSTGGRFFGWVMGGA